MSCLLRTQVQAPGQHPGALCVGSTRRGIFKAMPPSLFFFSSLLKNINSSYPICMQQQVCFHIPSINNIKAYNTEYAFSSFPILPSWRLGHSPLYFRLPVAEHHGLPAAAASVRPCLHLLRLTAVLLPGDAWPHPRGEQNQSRARNQPQSSQDHEGAESKLPASSFQDWQVARQPLYSL